MNSAFRRERRALTLSWARGILRWPRGDGRKRSGAVPAWSSWGLVSFSLVSSQTGVGISLLTTSSMVDDSVDKVHVALFSVIAPALFLVIAHYR